MLPEEILKNPARVLTQAQREKYFTDGFVSVEEIVPADVLAELQTRPLELPTHERLWLGSLQTRWNARSGEHAG